MCSAGLVVAQNDKDAVRWYLYAAGKHLAESQYNLGEMYRMGKGIKINYSEAMNWYKRAAQQGITQAQYKLGNMYRLGQGLMRDTIKAHMWFNIAAVNGDKESLADRDIMAREMTQQQIEQAQRLALEYMNSNFNNCD